MALKNTLCGIVHHALRTQAHCQTMVSRYKLPSGTVWFRKFCRRGGHMSVYCIPLYIEKNLRLVGFHQMHCCTERSIVHHTRRTRAHCPTMVLSFKLSSETVCVPRLCRF